MRTADLAPSPTDLSTALVHGGSPLVELLSVRVHDTSIRHGDGRLRVIRYREIAATGHWIFLNIASAHGFYPAASAERSEVLVRCKPKLASPAIAAKVTLH